MLKIINSGSKGNGYILETHSEALIIEAGVKLNEVKEALDFNIDKIVGCIVTHEHSDHSKYSYQYTNNGIDVYTSAGTIQNLPNRSKISKYKPINKCYHGKSFKLGGFTIKPFDVKHDAAQPFGYLIKHPELGKILFLTDTHYTEYRFRGLNHIIVEANYSQELLEENIEKGRIHPLLLNRVESSHMSIDTCMELLNANDLKDVKNIILIHLSDNNADMNYFKKQIQEITGVPVYVAQKNMSINLNF